MEGQKENEINSTASGVENKMIETYAEDMAHIIGDDKGGLIKKIIQDEEEREVERVSTSPETKKNELFLLAGIVLVAVAIAIFFFLFSDKAPDNTPIQTEFMPMILNDRTEFIDIAGLTKTNIAEAIFEEIEASDLEPGELERIHLSINERDIGLREFFKLIESNIVLGAPESVDDNFLLGVFYGETKNLFLMLEIHSAPLVFENMRAWEGKMLGDMHGLFGLYSTPDTDYLFIKEFEDGFIQNRNGRILYDKTGGIVLMYVFVDDTHLVITNNQGPIREVITRLAGSRVKK